MIKLRKSLTCLIIAMMVITSVFTANTARVDAAAARGTVDALVEHALSHVGQNYKLNGCETFHGDWCASFIGHCAYKTGCTNALPYDPAKQKYGTLNVASYSDMLVNKYNAQVNFVNKESYNYFLGNYTAAAKSRVKYDQNYVPKKGDLIIFTNGSPKYRSHMGLVYASSSSSKDDLHSIEGNTAHNSYKSAKVSLRKNCSKSNVIAYVTPRYKRFTIKYNGSGGIGSMANTSVSYGVNTPLRTNQFIKNGYEFLGWTAKRDNGTWFYVNPKNSNNSGWYKEGKAPKGWKKYIYRDKGGVSRTYDKNNGVVTFYAQWKATKAHWFYYKIDGVIGNPQPMYVLDGRSFSVTQTVPTKSGFTFEGWTACRLKDGKYYVSGKGWISASEIAAKGYEKALYNFGKAYTFNGSWTNGCSGPSHYILEPQWKKNAEPVKKYIIEYNANGGVGTMAPSTIIYGQPQQLRRNTFTRNGYTFDGWYIYRSGINKWAYTNGKESHWYAKGQQPSGYWLETYKIDAKVKGTTSVDGEVVILYAKWKVDDTHYFEYDLKGGSKSNGSFDSMSVRNESTFSITWDVPVRDGYSFAGWNAYRMKDQKYYVAGKGWFTNAEIGSKGYTKRLYFPGEEYQFGNAWTTGCSGNSNYRFEAVWERDEYVDNSGEVIGYVSEEDYYSYYADDDNYDATPYYRYAERKKEYTESTDNNLSGWTLYNTINKPASSDWSKTRPASGSYETGYLYSCYGWEHNGDWTFYYDNDYDNAVAWIRKNYTVWNYNQFRYFWQVYPSNKGSYVKVSQTVNYRDNAGRTGTKAIKGTKLWYEGTVYRQIGGTTYQYWRWGSWSGYGDWTTNRRAVNENVREEVRYYVVRK